MTRILSVLVILCWIALMVIASRVAVSAPGSTVAPPWAAEAHLVPSTSAEAAEALEANSGHQGWGAAPLVGASAVVILLAGIFAMKLKREDLL